MKTLDRYILRAFLTNYAVALLVMMGLYVLLDLFINLDEFTKDPAQSWFGRVGTMIRYYGYNLFLYFAQLSGVVILAAACFTLGRFCRTNELTAIMAGGCSLYRVAAPLLLAALAMNGLWFIDQEVIIPRIAQQLAMKHDDIEGRRAFEVAIVPDRDRSLLFAAKFSPRLAEIRGLTVMRRDDQFRLTEFLRADAARWDETRQLWILENGYSMRLSGDQGSEVDELGRTWITEYPSDVTPLELRLQQASRWTSFVGLAELTRMQARRPGLAELIKVKHARLTTVITNMILLCLGIPFFLNRERPSVLVAGGKCLLVTASCFVLTFMCQNIDMSAVGLNPALPAWLPVILFGPAAVVLLDGIKT